MLGKRKLGSAIGALALIGGFMGAAGVSVVTATQAGAQPSGDYTCTVTDQNTGQSLTSSTLTYPAEVPLGTLTNVGTNDPLNFACSELEDNESVAIIQAAGLAAYDVTANQAKYADVGDGDTGDSADSTGVYNETITSSYSNADAHVTCPPNQAAVNLGATTCLITAADETTEQPLILVSVSYAGTPTPAGPSVTASTSTASNSTATPIGVTTNALGYWWGAGEEGSCNSSSFTATAASGHTLTIPPADASSVWANQEVSGTGITAGDTVASVNAGTGLVTLGDSTSAPVNGDSYTFACAVPAPTVLIDGATPIQLAGAGDGGSTLAITGASYSYAKTSAGPPAVAGGTPTYAKQTGGVTIPSGLTPGPHSVTIIEGTLEGGSINASFGFFVGGTTPTQGTGPAGTTGPTSNVTFTGSTGWDPNSTSTWSGEWIPPTGCNGNADIAAGSLTESPPFPTDPAGTESFTANTGDLASLFSDTTCVPGAWSLQVTQDVAGGTQVAQTTFGPFDLVDLAFTCSIATTGSCLVQQTIGQQVNGNELTVTEFAATQGIGAPGQNLSANLVNLSTVTLGPGVFQAGQGELNTVEVNDSRGTLSGWTVTGIMTGDFQDATPIGNDHSIPADYLTWNPSVSLTYPGNIAHAGDPDWIANGVIPGGSTEPGPYGPDTCAVGSAATGTNSKETCPTVNDNAGSNNPSGNPAGTPSGQIGGSTEPSNHAGEPTWPNAVGSEGPSGLLYEVAAGPIANLTESDSTLGDFQGPDSAVTLCSAPSGGGGGAFNCDASLSLAVPPYVAAGSYSATMDLLTTAT